MSSPNPTTEQASRTATILAEAKACTCAKFRPFPLLPLELRRQIWMAALPGPRVIRVNLADLLDMENPSKSGTFHDQKHNDESFDFEFHTTYHKKDKVHLLAASKESRAVALEILSRFIRLQPPAIDSRREKEGLSVLRFAPDDTLYFPFGFELMRFCERECTERSKIFFSNVRRVALKWTDLAMNFELKGWVDFLKRWKSLEYITVLAHFEKGKDSYEILDLVGGPDPLRPAFLPETEVTMSAADRTYHLSRMAQRYQAIENFRRSLQLGHDSGEAVSEGPHIFVAGMKQRMREESDIRGEAQTDRLKKLGELGNAKPRASDTTTTPCSICEPPTNTTFQQFARFPKRLRERIWNYAALEPGAQLLTITAHFVEVHEEVTDLRFKSDYYPPLLKVNTEARSATLQIYNCTIPSQGPSGIIRFRSEDTLFFPNMHQWIVREEDGKLHGSQHDIYNMLRDISFIAVSLSFMQFWFGSLGIITAKMQGLQRINVLRNVADHYGKEVIRHQHVMVPIKSLPHRRQLYCIAGDISQFVSEKRAFSSFYEKHLSHLKIPKLELVEVQKFKGDRSFFHGYDYTPELRKRTGCFEDDEYSDVEHYSSAWSRRRE